ncbi:MAG: hypothetical protein SFZ24_11095 [Planctomycetota bacterium]|nr:hypothetical protein [Planctomycetota bacterium]
MAVRPRRHGAPGSYTYSTVNGRENNPVNYVSFWDATRCANWLHNGQGAGDTETGAYTLTPPRRQCQHLHTQRRRTMGGHQRGRVV